MGLYCTEGFYRKKIGYYGSVVSPEVKVSKEVYWTPIFGGKLYNV